MLSGHPDESLSLLAAAREVLTKVLRVGSLASPRGKSATPERPSARLPTVLSITGRALAVAPASAIAAVFGNAGRRGSGVPAGAVWLGQVVHVDRASSGWRSRSPSAR